MKLATTMSFFQVEAAATPTNRGVANINYERKTLAVPGKRNPGTNYADSRYQLRGLTVPTTPNPQRGLWYPANHRKLAERYQITLNRKTVAKRMHLMGIEGMSPRAFVPATTIQAKRKSALSDLVKRMFDTGELNRVWMSDITYLRTGEGWLYLCVVRDGHSRRVLGWAMDSVQDTRLVERALRMAHTLRGDVPDGLVFHADRGTQFTSEQLWEVCRNLGVAQSVGRTGVCFDNALAESFWSTLKTEFYDRKRWPTRDVARQVVAYWIVVVYNRRRRHSALGMVSPIDFENHASLTTSRKEIAA